MLNKNTQFSHDTVRSFQANKTTHDVIGLLTRTACYVHTVHLHSYVTYVKLYSSVTY